MSDPAKDPRMKVATSAVQSAASMETMLSNFQTRGKAAIQEIKEALKKEKDKDARGDLKEAAKKIAELAKGAGGAKKTFAKMLSDYNDLKKEGGFPDFSEKLDSHAAIMKQTADMADAYRKIMASARFDKKDLSRFASLRGMENYSKTYLDHYGKFAPKLGKLKSMKGDDPDPKKDPRMGAVEDAMTALMSVESMLNNFETRGRPTLKELKDAEKKEKDKAAVKDLKATAGNVESLMKSAKNTRDEIGAILKEYQKLKKDGKFDVFLAKFKDPAAAVRGTLQHAANFTKALEKAKFNAKDVKTQPGLVGMQNYCKTHDKYVKDFLGAHKKAVG